MLNKEHVAPLVNEFMSEDSEKLVDLSKEKKIKISFKNTKTQCRSQKKILAIS